MEVFKYEYFLLLSWFDKVNVDDKKHKSIVVQIGRYESLIINGWINIHMISRGNPCFHLVDTMRELKKFTSKKIEVTIGQNVFTSKKTECHKCLKKLAKIKNEITIISFCAAEGTPQILLLAAPVWLSTNGFQIS